MRISPPRSPDGAHGVRNVSQPDRLISRRVQPRRGCPSAKTDHPYRSTAQVIARKWKAPKTPRNKPHTLFRKNGTRLKRCDTRASSYFDRDSAELRRAYLVRDKSFRSRRRTSTTPSQTNLITCQHRPMAVEMSSMGSIQTTLKDFAQMIIRYLSYLIILGA